MFAQENLILKVLWNWNWGLSSFNVYITAQQNLSWRYFCHFWTEILYFTQKVTKTCMNPFDEMQQTSKIWYGIEREGGLGWGGVLVDYGEGGGGGGGCPKEESLGASPDSTSASAGPNMEVPNPVFRTISLEILFLLFVLHNNNKCYGKLFLLQNTRIFVLQSVTPQHWRYCWYDCIVYRSTT